MAETLVDSSLNALQDEQTSLIFRALGVCPEDVAVPLPAVHVICGADAEVAAKGKTNALLMRRAVKALLDRNLLQGSIAMGIFMHDIVRDLVRARYGGEDELRAKQRSVVAAFVEVCPGGGWAADDVMGQYAASALHARGSVD